MNCNCKYIKKTKLFLSILTFFFTFSVQAQYTVTSTVVTNWTLTSDECGGSVNVTCNAPTLGTPPIGLTFSFSGGVYYPSNGAYQSGTGSYLDTSCNDAPPPPPPPYIPPASDPCPDFTGFISATNGGVLDCNNNQLFLYANPSSTTEYAYGWWTPCCGGTVQGYANWTTATEAGVYTVEIRPWGSEYECAETVSFTVTDTRVYFTSTAYNVPLSCDSEDTELHSTGPSGSSYSWSGPNGFSSNEQSPIVSEIGDYDVTVTKNGCTRTASTTVEPNFVEMNLVATNEGPLTCNNEDTQLAVTAPENSTYLWSGPNEFSSNLPNPTVAEIGTYTVTVTSNSVCTATASTIVEITEVNPTITATDEGIITCENENIQLSVGPDGASYSWSGPNGFTTAEQNPTVTEAGTYEVTVTQDGCTGTASIMIENTIPVEGCSTYDVTLTKTVDQTQTTIDNNVVFTISITNNGDAVTGTTVTDVLPNGSVYVSDDSGGAYDNATGLWNIGDLANGEGATLNITVTLTEEGVHTNIASVAINETETDLTNNEDSACVSIPVEICDDGSQTVTLTAASGHTSYQWYLNGIAIDGATSDTYDTTVAGEYNYTIDGGLLNDACTNQMCCPLVLIGVECNICPTPVCIPVTITKNN